MLNALKILVMAASTASTIVISTIGFLVLLYTPTIPIISLFMFSLAAQRASAIVFAIIEERERRLFMAEFAKQLEKQEKKERLYAVNPNSP